MNAEQKPNHGVLRIIGMTVFTTLCVFAGLFRVIQYIDNYYLGRNGEMPGSLWLFVAFFVGMFWYLVAFGWVIAECCLRKIPFVKILILVVSVGMFFYSPSVLRYGYLLGYREYILRTLTAEQLDHIADVAKTHVSPNYGMSSPEKFGTTAEGNKEWDAFAKAANLNVIPEKRGYVVGYDEDRKLVQIEWGSALAGYWGVRIAEEKVPKDEYDYTFLPINDRIAVYNRAD